MTQRRPEPSLGKKRRLAQATTPQGVFIILAIDHRGPLRRKLAGQPGAEDADAAVAILKQDIVRELAPLTSAVLLDPEIGLNVVDLGMIGSVRVESDGAVVVEVMPTTPGCPMHDALAQGVQRFIGGLGGVTAVEVRFVYDPPWTPDRIAPDTRTLLGL